jgi:hypothetical protein
MRRAEPQELATAAMPVPTAHVTGAELTRWFPTRFEDIEDPLEAAEAAACAVTSPQTVAPHFLRRIVSISLY